MTLRDNAVAAEKHRHRPHVRTSEWIRLCGTEQFERLPGRDIAIAAQRKRAADSRRRPAELMPEAYDYAGACAELSSLAAMIQAHIARQARQ
jgi:hypothetical protein